MGLTAIVSSSASSSAAGVSSTVTSLLSPIGVGVGGIFVAVTLVALLAYLDLLDTTGNEETRNMVVATVIPLLFAFGGVVLFKSLAVI